MDLVILAAGMGSRFGGLKQIEPIDEAGHFIIDYSIFDAKRAGFDRVIFIIKEENLDIFRSTIGKRVEDKIETHYVIQKLDLLPEGYSLPAGRTKPLGTAQAILAAKEVVGNASFAMINSDDFYGRDAFEVAASFLRSLPENSKGLYANVGYKAANTMTENGSVKRGVLVFDENAHLTELIESKLERVDGKIRATPLEGKAPMTLPEDALVSMNLFCFTHEIMDRIEEGFPRFMEENKDHHDSAEYLLPTLVSETMERDGATVKVLGTSAVWHGVTYREDKPDVVASIARLVEQGEYPKKLW